MFSSLHVAPATLPRWVEGRGGTMRHLPRSLREQVRVRVAESRAVGGCIRACVLLSGGARETVLLC